VSAARTFRLTVAYDGSDFHGWQRQPGPRTVQGELEAALARVLGVGTVATAGAGRTDTGVHARGQVASFTHATPLPARALPPLLNRELPRDVRVLAAAEAPDGFHARHSARARRYEYRLLPAADVLRQRYAWAPGRLPPLGALAPTGAPLRGTHDCSAFRATSETVADPVCSVSLARWRPWEDGVAFEIVANHFLYHMVRNIVGAALAAARAPDPAAHMRAVLGSRDRRRGGRTAPPEGLSLEQVYFAGDEPAGLLESAGPRQASP
jgi:tRNA pseudouridine38-40 synthase